ncbi:hypothetical protein LguiB_022386 [Lonicera macranthoides]
MIENSISLASWWKKVRRSSSVDTTQAATIFLWSIWRNHNDKVWRNKVGSTALIIRCASRFFDEW